MHKLYFSRNVKSGVHVAYMRVLYLYNNNSTDDFSCLHFRI